VEKEHPKSISTERKIVWVEKKKEWGFGKTTSPYQRPEKLALIHHEGHVTKNPQTHRKGQKKKNTPRHLKADFSIEDRCYERRGKDY